MKVYISPQVSQTKDDNGIGRVIHAQFKYLPEHGIELVGSPDNADIIAAHVTADGLPRIDVLHCHGLYWTGDSGGTYDGWHHDANSRIIEAARQAVTISVPSNWVAMPFRRDMRLTPAVIGHGIDWESWQPASKHTGYILWNKNRASDVCNPLPAHLLAERGFDVVSTFAAKNRVIPAKLRVIGAVKHDVMKELIRNAEIYLATTQETFGIGTLEALAAGVPVLGYDWGGTSDLIQHKINGYLVKPGDIEGLIEGIEWIRSSRAVMSETARLSSQRYGWDKVIEQYVELYHQTYETKQSRGDGVSVVVTCYNYANYVGDAIESVLSQTERPAELIIVNDGSKDNSIDVIRATLARHDIADTKIIVIDQENQGVAAARNNGVKAATQEHVICLDADDMLAPAYLETLHNAMLQDRGLGIAYTGLLMVNEDGSRFGENGFPPEFNWENQTTPHTPPYNCIPCAAMFRREMWRRSGGVQQIYAPGEDAEFWTRGLSIGFRAKRINTQPLLRYRLHSNGAHVTKKYKSIDLWHPWMRDKRYPMGAPSKKRPIVYSYSEPLISVVIPVGPGHARYLFAAIDSILGQTFRQWELIVVNDSGESLDLVPYPFVKKYQSDARHPGAARNIGIEQARAPFLFFLDADDYIAPHALEALSAKFVESEHYVYSDWVAVEGEKTTLRKSGEYQQDQIANLMPHAVTALVPTAWARDVGGFDEVIRGWEEWDFYAKLASKGYCGIRLPEALLYYRTDTGQVRKQSFANKEELTETIKSRHGEIKMGCCGGSGTGAEIVALRKEMIQGTRAFEQEQTTVLWEGAPVVRMKFIGQQTGEQTWKSKIEPRNPSRQYRGANNDTSRYIDAHKDDVEFLLSTRVWEVVNQPVQPTVTTRAIDIINRSGPVEPTVETVKPVERVVIEKPVPEETDRPAWMVDPKELTGEIPESVQQVKEPEQPRKRAGRPRQRGYEEE